MIEVWRESAENFNSQHLYSALLFIGYCPLNFYHIPVKELGYFSFLKTSCFLDEKTGRKCCTWEVNGVETSSSLSDHPSPFFEFC